MTIASLVVKVLSIVYKIPYQNLTGDMGFYIYQTVYPLFSLLLSFSTYSIPLVTSELILQYGRDHLRPYRYLLMFTFWGISLFLFFMSGPLAQLFNDKFFTPFMYLLSGVSLLVPLIGYLRGQLFAREQTVYRVGVSQMIEQIIRVFFVGVVLYQFAQKRISDLYIVAQYSYLGLLLGQIGAFMYLFLSCRSLKRQRQSSYERLERQLPGFHKLALRRIVLLTLSASVLLLMQLIDGVTFSHLLEDIVGRQEAQILKGIYDRSLPLIQGALFFLSPLLSSYLPYLKKYQEPYGRLLEWVLLLVLPITVGLWLVFPHVNLLLFKSTLGNDFLRLNLLVIVLYAFILTLMAIPSTSLWTDYLIVGISLIIKLGLNFAFIPLFQVCGVVYSNIVSLFILFAGLIILRHNHISFSLDNVVKIVVVTLVMGITVSTSNNISFFQPWFRQVILGGMVYVALIVILNPLNLRQSIGDFIHKK